MYQRPGFNLGRCLFWAAQVANGEVLRSVLSWPAHGTKRDAERSMWPAQVENGEVVRSVLMARPGFRRRIETGATAISRRHD